MMKRITLGLMLSGSFLVAHAQQIPQSNLYNFSKFNLNSAYAGFNDELEIYGSHFNQWTGIDDAPTTNYLAVHSVLKNKLAVGGRIASDKAGFLTRSSARASFSYNLPLSTTTNHNLRLGLSTGLYNIKLNTTNALVEDESDEIAGQIKSGLAFDNEFSLFYNYENFQLGVSVPQVFQSRTSLDLPGESGYLLSRHLSLYSGYKIEANEKWQIEPSVYFKSVVGGLNQLDVNALVTYDDLLSLGATYRTHVGPLAKIGLHLKGFLLAYSYEYGGGKSSSLSSGSHEIMLGYRVKR